MSCSCGTKPSSSTSTFCSTCAPGALAGGLVRTRFFVVMVLTQSDLENEQRYWRIKRRLTNRALGEGVVWGLRVRWDAARRVFVLGPVYALDCCGNDLVVECPVQIAEADLIKLADPLYRSATPAVFEAAARYQQNPLRSACLVLQYVECPQDARPVQTDACTPPTSRCESSRIRETTRLLLVPPPPPEPPTCIDDFIADLDTLKQSITDPQLRDALFPPAPAPAPGVTPDATLPVSLKITTPGSGATSTTGTPLANGTVNADTISSTRTPSGTRSGVVQFELTPTSGWGFYQGQVKDGDVVVDMVAPPLDLQQFWSLELALGDARAATRTFSYVIDSLGLEQMFGERAKGLATMTITGELTVNAGSNDQVVTKVASISVATTSTVGEASATGSCFDVLRGGIMADPAHASKDHHKKQHTTSYAYFADVTSRSGGGWTASRMLGQLLYIAAWRLLGIDVNSATEAQRQELGKLIARLFECWCEAMLYPGPRCSTEHHGVYLGCATITQLGQIVDFDMWEHRREVITGPLINHWLGVFGFAPIDVVAGRISQAICCLAGLQIPTLATQVIERQPTNVNHYDAVAVPIGMGSVAVGAASSGAAADVSPASLIARVVSGLVGASNAPLATYRSRLANGTVVEVRAPAMNTAVASGSIDASVEPIVRGLTPALSPINRSVVARATTELAREVPATAVTDLGAPASQLASSLGGMTLASLVAAGT